MTSTAVPPDVPTSSSENSISGGEVGAELIQMATS